MSDHRPVHLALLWHMHQPYYKDVRTGKAIMPWVRLHGTKDYLDMIQVLEEFPGVRCNFNMVPSLMEQIEDFNERGVTDLVWDLTVRPAAALNDGEKQFLVQKFFYAHYDNMIKPHERYRELFDKRGWARTDAELARAAAYFHEGDYRDLQVWYNLCWIDPLHFERDPAMKALIAKGRDFTEADKAAVLAKHRELMGGIVPACRDAAARGQVEISTTPFYHPIMPLVYDTNLARVARPDIAVPKQRFHHPEDVVAQVKAAVEAHERWFGERPRGMWPSEGSVAPEILPILAEHGIQWIATDEEVLGHSTGNHIRRDLSGTVQDPGHLYRPHAAEHEGARLSVVFRDHFMSDLVGFQYASWRPEDAANDLVGRIEAVARAAAESGAARDRPLLLPIILDGENCWEHYHDDGLPFLRAFYGRLQESNLVGSSRIGDFIEQYPPPDTLPRLHTGSWINHDFGIWIGHKEDNQSWDYLYETREMVAAHIEAQGDKLSPEAVATAWKEIHIAEGSDWNWWYGDDHSSGIDDEFDQLYRDHLMSACLAVGLPPPSYLHIPIVSRGGTSNRASEPRAFIQPDIDGQVTSYYEWFAAGHFDPTQGGGSMHQAQYLLRRMFHGFDSQAFYFRIDADASILKAAEADEVTLNLHVVTPETWVVRIPLRHQAGGGAVIGAATGGTTGGATQSSPFGLPLSAATPPPMPMGAQPQREGAADARVTATLMREVGSTLERVKTTGPAAAGQVVELAVPFSDLRLEPGREVYFYATLEVNGREVERCPARTPIRTEVPAPNYETKMWVV